MKNKKLYGNAILCHKVAINNVISEYGQAV